MTLKICWAGWTGPDMAEIASGILPLDPDPQFYILGSGTTRDERAYYLGHGRRNAFFTTPERFFSEVNNAGADVLIHNTFTYATGHRPEIHPMNNQAATITQNKEWKDISAFKILHEGESFTQFEYYKKAIDYFDGVITYSRKLKDLCDERKIPCYQSYICCPATLTDPGLERDIAVSYTGSNLGVDYRGKIKSILEGLPEEYPVTIRDGGFAGFPVEDYVNMLNRSKIHQCTHGAADGKRLPFAIKNREGKALLCGALPICEVYPEADGYLAPDTEKAVFNSMGELKEKILYYLEHEDQRRAIVEAGKKKIRENFTADILFRKAFAHFGLL